MKILDIKCAKTHTFGLYNLFLGSMFHFNFIPGIQRVLFKALLYISLEFLYAITQDLVMAWPG